MLFSIQNHLFTPHTLHPACKRFNIFAIATSSSSPWHTGSPTALSHDVRNPFGEYLTSASNRFRLFLSKIARYSENNSTTRYKYNSKTEMDCKMSYFSKDLVRLGYSSWVSGGFFTTFTHMSLLYTRCSKTFKSINNQRYIISGGWNFLPSPVIPKAFQRNF